MRGKNEVVGDGRESKVLLLRFVMLRAPAAFPNMVKGGTLGFRLDELEEE